MRRLATSCLLGIARCLACCSCAESEAPAVAAAKQRAVETERLALAARDRAAAELAVLQFRKSQRP